jgi:hypothetical protein
VFFAFFRGHPAQLAATEDIFNRRFRRLMRILTNTAGEWMADEFEYWNFSGTWNLELFPPTDS